MNRWSVSTNLEPFEKDGAYAEFDGTIQVTLPSDIWITPEEARQFARELLDAAYEQEAHNITEAAK